MDTLEDNAFVQEAQGGKDQYGGRKTAVYSAQQSYVVYRFRACVVSHRTAQSKQRREYRRILSAPVAYGAYRRYLHEKVYHGPAPYQINKEGPFTR